MRWWLDRGVDGFRMDVINFIPKTEGLPDAPAIPGQRFVNAMDKFVDGPHVHDYLAEMTWEVFTGRNGEFITIGETPGVTPEQARLYTDPARGEAERGFSVRARVRRPRPSGQIRLRRSRLGRPEECAPSVASGVGGNRLEQPVLEQPRPASRRVPIRRRQPRLLGCLGEGARDRAARHAWHPVVYQGEELGMTNYPFRNP
jgi:oligo-1,6-glucosidase